MTATNLQRRSRICKPALHPVLWHSASTCFVGTLITDITYWRTAEMMWANFSAWLLTAGLLLGALAGVAFFVDWTTGRLTDAYAITWPYLVGNIVVLLVSFFNALVHSRDAWTSVVPAGLTLSFVAVVVLVVGGIAARTMVYRRRRGVLA